MLQFAIFLLIIAWIARGAWDLLALRRPVSWGRAIGAGFVLLVVVDIVNLALDPLLHPGREQGLTPSRWEPHHAGAFAPFAFAVVVLAPVTEELAFRGLGFGLLRPFGLVPPIVGTAVIWAFAHGLLEALPVIVVLGIGLAWIRYRQDSTIPGMFVHATFNGLALARVAPLVIRAGVVALVVVLAGAWIAYVHVWRYGDAHPLAYRFETVPGFETPRAAVARHARRRPGARARHVRPALVDGLLDRGPARARRARPHLDRRARARQARAREDHVPVSFARVPRPRQARPRALGGTLVSEPDPIMRQLREAISDNDRKLMEALNKRLELVARLKRYKESHGVGFVDPEREEWMLSYLQRANRGPLSADGVREFFTRVLELTKREVS